MHLSVRAWLYAEKTIGWNGVCVSQSFGELVGGFSGINPMKVPTQQHTNACWFQPIGNWNKQLV